MAASEPKAYLYWRTEGPVDAEFDGETRAPYASVDEAVEQAVHDVRAGRDVHRVTDGDGKTVHNLTELRKRAKA